MARVVEARIRHVTWPTILITILLAISTAVGVVARVTGAIVGAREILAWVAAFLLLTLVHEFVHVAVFRLAGSETRVQFRSALGAVAVAFGETGFAAYTVAAVAPIIVLNGALTLAWLYTGSPKILYLDIAMLLASIPDAASVLITAKRYGLDLRVASVVDEGGNNLGSVLVSRRGIYYFPTFVKEEGEKIRIRLGGPGKLAVKVQGEGL